MTKIAKIVIKIVKIAKIAMNIARTQKIWTFRKLLPTREKVLFR
jgi:hypothetical protein